MSTVTITILSKSVAAKEIGVSESTIRNMVKGGILRTARMGNRDYVLTESVEEVKKDRADQVRKAEQLQEGKCRCGCGADIAMNRKYLPGHDERLQRAVESTYRVGNVEERDLARRVAEREGIKLT